jgi:SAM-dependent methyltransferase
MNKGGPPGQTERMDSISEVKTTLRTVDESKYPQLRGYTKTEIWRDIGPGGLYLVSLLANALRLRPNAWVLDLGCGSAESSLFLAGNFKAKVIAADLWTDPADNAKKIKSRGHSGDIFPLRLDASQPLPFAEGLFDAILCVNSLNFFGTDIAVVDRIVRHLKKGGIFCAGGECLNEEFTPDQIANPPAVYHFAETVWEDDFLTLHSPGW